MAHKPTALVTNDDSIDSQFLHCLVDALSEQFQVIVAAPATEQSWIGRAVSRHRDVTVQQSESHFDQSIQAWSIDGTPTDCINIALGNLLQNPPDIVISGINIGYNTTETLILSSGTVAGAIEGALWGLPAIAFSLCVPGNVFEAVRSSNGHTTGAFKETLRCAAQRATQISLQTVESPPREGIVVNVNFPAPTQLDSPIKETYPAKIKLGSLYQETSPGTYQFRYSDGILVDNAPDTDRTTLNQGYISYSLLDFSKIGTRPQSQ